MSDRDPVGGVRSVAVVPSALGLLPDLTSPDDPLREVRAAAQAAAVWLVERHPGDVGVLAAPQRGVNVARGVMESSGLRIGRALLGVAAGAPMPDPGAAAGLLVVANGSATRSEKAPGHLDERSFGFDDALDAALRAGRPERMRELDADLAEQLWCFDAPVWHGLADLAEASQGPVDVDYDDDPFGVRYWVVRWTCAS